MDEDKKIVTIIGSLTSSKEDIEEASRFFKDLGFKVLEPVRNDCHNEVLYYIQRRYIDYIVMADFIVLISKPNGTIGESTSYELAIANYFNKKVLEWNIYPYVLKSSINQKYGLASLENAKFLKEVRKMTMYEVYDSRGNIIDRLFDRMEADMYDYAEDQYGGKYTIKPIDNPVCSY